MFFIPFIIFTAIGLNRARAELPPCVYEEMVGKATEVIRIQVEQVQVKMSGTQKKIRADARVTQVQRSDSGLSPGQSISIRYEIDTEKLNMPGPSQPPVLEKGLEYPAYLKANTVFKYFSIAVGGKSFSPWFWPGIDPNGTKKTGTTHPEDISRALTILDQAGRETDLDPVVSSQALAGEDYDKVELDRITHALDKAYDALETIERTALAHSDHPELLSEVLRVAGFAAVLDPGPIAGEIMIRLYQKEKTRIRQILGKQNTDEAKRLLLYFESADSVEKYGNDPGSGFGTIESN